MSDQEKEAAEAFESSVMGYQFLGRPLEKWTTRRQIAAQAMGMKAPGFTEEDIEAIKAGRAYAGALKDAVIFFWILSQTDAALSSEAWTVRRARSNPAAAYDAAEGWADAEGFADQQSEKWAEAYPLMLAILRGVQVSEFLLKSEDKGSVEKKEDSQLV